MMNMATFVLILMMLFSGQSPLAFFILKETSSSIEIFGAILILAGIYIASRFDRDKVLDQSS
jgi:drug/metabolite transporter (DMT)-like permease